MLWAFMARVDGSAVGAPGGAPGAERRSFEAFFADEHARLQRALFVVSGNQHEAEELMQASFVAVWERWDRVGMMDDPTGYLFRTAMNRYRSGVRRARRMAARAFRPTGGSDGFVAIDERDALARALASLPTRQRAAVVLTELLGFDAGAAARVLRVKDATVRSLASQGRAALRSSLGEDDA
jgi:RNA polymerase sigma factor (sigma-70 family)